MEKGEEKKGSERWRMKGEEEKRKECNVITYRLIHWNKVIKTQSKRSAKI